MTSNLTQSNSYSVASRIEKTPSTEVEGVLGLRLTHEHGRGRFSGWAEKCLNFVLHNMQAKALIALMNKIFQ